MLATSLNGKLGIKSRSGTPLPHTVPRPRGGGRQSKSRPEREKTPQPTPEAKSAAPRGSSIANKLGRHAAQSWTSIPVPQQAIQVRTLSPSPTTVPPGGSLAPALAPCPALPTRSHFGANVSHRRRLASREGSPAYWAPRLAVPPSGHKTSHGIAAEACNDPSQTHYPPGSAFRDPLPYSKGPHILPKGTPSPLPSIQAGERALCISHLR